MEVEQNQPKGMYETVPNNYKWLISSGLPFLDEFLGGGLHRGLISQLYGESGTGKTQLCMQFMMGAALHGIASFYISSEKRLHEERFKQMCQHFEQRMDEYLDPGLFNIRHSIAGQNTFDNCYVEFIEMLEKQRLAGKERLGLFIIDNITSIILDKSEVVSQEPNSTVSRQMPVFEKSRIQKEFVNTLRQNAKTYRFAVLLVNNAASPIFQNTNTIKHYSQERPIVPALGKSWNTEIDESIQATKASGGNRTLKMVFSPKAPSKQLKFRIEINAGITNQI